MKEQRPVDSGLETLAQQVDALVDGELDDAEAAALKQAAEADHALARAIIEAWQLQRGIEELGIQRAPASLRRKLLRIPAAAAAGERPGWWTSPAGRMALAAVAALVLALAVIRPWEPSQSDVRQARRELGTAFAYIDKFSQRSGEEIEYVLASQMHQELSAVFSRTVPLAEIPAKPDVEPASQSDGETLLQEDKS